VLAPRSAVRLWFPLKESLSLHLQNCTHQRTDHPLVTIHQSPPQPASFSPSPVLPNCHLHVHSGPRPLDARFLLVAFSPLSSFLARSPVLHSTHSLNTLNLIHSLTRPFDPSSSHLPLLLLVFWSEIIITFTHPPNISLPPHRKHTLSSPPLARRTSNFSNALHGRLLSTHRIAVLLSG
jgi:hypothetical protein